MWRKLIFFQLVVYLILITGCVPISVNNYYSPSAEEGIVKKSLCNESAGSKDTIAFLRNEVIIKVSAYKIENTISISLRLEIPGGRQVRFSDFPVQTILSSEQGLFEGVFEPIVYQGQTPWAVDDTLIGQTKEFHTFIGVRADGKVFAMQTKLAMPVTDTFKVRLPALIINEAKFVLPEIVFKKDKSIEFFMPINC